MVRFTSFPPSERSGMYGWMYGSNIVLIKAEWGIRRPCFALFKMPSLAR